jgi:hypothetical protein
MLTGGSHADDISLDSRNQRAAIPDGLATSRARPTTLPVPDRRPAHADAAYHLEDR